MFRNPLLLIALSITSFIAVWGIVDTASLTAFAQQAVALQFSSRAWFIMLTVSFLLLTSLYLALSPYGNIRLGREDELPEFSTASWLSMLFSAGMGVGLLYWGTAEPLTHYSLVKSYAGERVAAGEALLATYFHWGFHAWAIYGLTGLVIAYFSFRRGTPSLIGAPITDTFGDGLFASGFAWISNLLAIVAIAIGLGGSVAMGVFQVKDGLDVLFGFEDSGLRLTLIVFGVLVACYILPLMVELDKGMALLSNTAMVMAGLLLGYLLLIGPTAYLMSGIVEGFGNYIARVLPQGFQTYTFMDTQVHNWFADWTLTYMVWWLSWAPFVGVFIARISRGRTIREFLTGVIIGPTVFSILWFGIFGGIGFHSILEDHSHLLDVVETNLDGVTYAVLDLFPLPMLTSAIVVIAAFLFVITSVVSAAFVLGMFSTGGDLNPPAKVKLAWGAVLGALGLVMILSGSIEAVKSIIALGALPFVFIVLVLVVCLLRTLKEERGHRT
ncbi:BCCT family transporter [Shimia thalassica]|uniref:BCCT family transporter n=1 Tax=Shimia thalassica TaxID=1715693 RepID=UPI0027333F59|nr:BCCT family transporter [Shimia thalassica]MDP2492484.1 BCCT family transporter [Shimia thalassica]